MSWGREEVVAICDRLGLEATLWLLVIAEKKNVGTGRAANYTTYPGKIKSYAKEHGLEPPEDDKIRQGFRRLKRAELEVPEGARDTVIEGDKPDYIKLTNVGLTLVTIIESDAEIRRAVKSGIGIEIDDQEPWWPDDIDPDGASITLKAISEPPENDPGEYEIEAVAEFSCDQCDNTIEHSYTFIYPVEAWSEDVTVSCEECGITWKHKAGDPYQDPMPAE